MKKRHILLALLAIVVLLIASRPNNLKPITVFKAGTRVGNLNLSRVSYQEGLDTLNSKINEPIYINFESKSRGVTPAEMGVSLDIERLTKQTMTCRFRVFRYFCNNTSNEKINPNEVFMINHELAQAFVRELNTEIQVFAENNIISFEDFSFRAVSPEAKISINEKVFLEPDNLAKLITIENFAISIDTSPQENPQGQQDATRELIQNMQKPLLIKYGRNPVSIPADKIAEFINTEEREGFLYGIIDRNKISEYLNELHAEYASDDVVIIHDVSVDAIARGLLFRAADYEINNAVVLPLEGQPVTNGELHDEYLELVKSQQRLYKFKDGKLDKVYVVSTGLTWETPAGEFEVLGKQKITISYYDDWYMPNYLPIGTIDGYFFGFHEIPYHIDGNGNIYSRDANTMGSPATGGCIQLRPGDSLEVFNNTPVGTPVYIYE